MDGGEARGPGHYTAADGCRYRVRPLRGHPALTVTERDDGRWRVVALLPEDAVPDAFGDAVPDAFTEFDPPGEALGLRSWLARLEALGTETKRSLAALLLDYDDTRSFSSDPWDRDYDVDLLHAARAALPLLAALEDAVDTVRECCERDRG